MDSFFTPSQRGKKFDELRVLILVVDSSISDTSSLQASPSQQYHRRIKWWMVFYFGLIFLLSS